MTVSVIMSAYNVGSTISRAIQSVLDQTHRDLQLIVVNDCSTDNTEDIVKQFDDERIIYVKHDTNLGCGMARRTGIHNATGEYIAFLDSDDWYKEDYIETLVQYAVDNDAELIQSGCIRWYGDSEETSIPEFKVAYGNDKFGEVKNFSYAFLNAALIKRSLFNTFEYSDARFDEDGPTLIKLILLSNKRVFVPYAGYYYNSANPNSVCAITNEVKKNLYRALAVFEVIDFCAQRKLNVNFADNIKTAIQNLKSVNFTDEIVGNYRTEVSRALNGLLKLLNV